MPSANALIAFETAARHGSFTLAAQELSTSQPAVSRQIGRLENWLSVRLFERTRAGVTLTDAGERFRDGVSAGLAAIHRGATEAAGLSDAEELIIACSHEASHFFILPRYDALRRALGEDICVHVLTYHHHHRQSLPSNLAADIRLAWSTAGAAPEDSVMLHEEAVRPVCSPAYAAEHARTFAGPVAGWSGLTFLDLSRSDQGWASWQDWFAVAGRPAGTLRHLSLDSYTHVLEAAAAGHGIALGWRHFVDRFLDAGTLVGLGEGFVEFDSALYGLLTGKGRRKPLARRCLAFFNQHGNRDASRQQLS